MNFHTIQSRKTVVLALAATLGAFFLPEVRAQTTGPIKVFFVAGQSNAQGHGFITEQASGVEVQGTLRHFVDNNPSYSFLRPSGSWVVRNDTWMWVRQGPVGSPNDDTYSTGNLTAGFGAGTNGGATSWAIGPEFGMGMKLGDYFTEQVVIVKICWGGTSLVGDWRPPSAVAKRGGVVGSYYNIFLSTWQQAKTALEARYPSRAIEIKGFGWHQGENDRFSTAATAEYEANLADLIVDLRAALNAPGMSVVIATTSDGPAPSPPNLWLDIENAQLAMSSRENVATVSTRPNYRLPAVSPRNEDIHWNKNAESVYKNGELMGDAMVALLSTPDTPDTTPPSPSPLGFATAPTAVNSGNITMTANTASDINGVQYRFVETSGKPGGTSSAWQYSPTYIDSGLTPGMTYSYTVQARDQSVAANLTTAQAALSATTPAADTTPPAPSPMTFSSAPAAANAININMTATLAVDANYPVEYYFEETTGNTGGTDSGWQSSRTFSDTGLKPNTTYSYRVKARDKESTPNETGWSAVSSATTPAVPAGTIVWSTPSDISGPSDVSTNGTLVSSYTGHNAGGNVIVNGVTFAEGRIPNAQSSGGDIGSRVPTTGNANYDTFLRSISWNYTGEKVTFTGLNPGGNYEIQIWAADNVNTPTGMTSIVLSHGTIYAVSLVHEPLSGAPGQFTTGTFTASGTTQEFNLATYNYYGTPSEAAGGAAITNGLQLRLISGGAPDTTAPTPNPSSFATPPASSGSSGIVMTATTASDVSGVEYYFDETSGNPGGSDSGWRSSPSYLDTGLNASTSYTYRVKTRDLSPAANETGYSAVQSATTAGASANTLVSFDVNTNVGRNPPPGTYTGAGPLGGGTWSSATTPAGSTHNTLAASSLTDSTGAATSLGMSVEYEGAWDVTHRTEIHADMKPLLGDYILLRNPFPTSTINITGLNPTTTSWTLVLFSGVGQGQGGSFTVNGATKAALDSGTVGATLIENDEYVTFTGIGSSNIVIAWQLGTFSGFQLMQTGSAAVSDYTTWAAIYTPADLSDPAADLDNDGLTNDKERAFGLNPTRGSSVNPISVPLNPDTGTFSYTRRTRDLTNLNYTVWTSTTMAANEWTDRIKGTDYTESIITSGDIESVTVTLDKTLSTAPALFVRVSASAAVN